MTLRVERTGSITWTPCGTVQCASLSVPLDAAHPTGAHITLALARRPASGRRVGVLFSNPGGPGGSGVDFLRDSGAVFPHEILRAFDLVSWDPRGIGHSSPLECDEDLDAFYAVDRDPTSAAGVATNVEAARGLVAACRRGSKSMLPFVSTAASARDIDAIRAAMGEERISYLGFSYGTFLGALYAEAFPQHVRAAVLDGAIDPSLPYAETTVQQAVGFERELDSFFDWCEGAPDCGFARGGDPRAAYDSLQRMITAEPVPANVAGETRELGPGEFDIGVASALYSGDTGFARLGAALAQAARGIGDQLLTFSDEYTDRKSDGRYSTETAALYATGCPDAPVPATLADVQQLATTAARVAPHFGATTVWLGLPCTYWPVRATGPARPVHARRRAADPGGRCDGRSRDAVRVGRSRSRAS